MLENHYRNPTQVFSLWDSIVYEQADNHTMGMSCLIQMREFDKPQPFIPPSWANVYRSPSDLPNRGMTIGGSGNFWWLELGGDQESIHDTEEIRFAWELS